MSPLAAKLAATTEKAAEMAAVAVVDTVEAAEAVTVVIDRCFLPFAPHVVHRLRFLSNQIQQSLFIAATALRSHGTLDSLCR